MQKTFKNAVRFGRENLHAVTKLLDSCLRKLFFKKRNQRLIAVKFQHVFADVLFD